MYKLTLIISSVLAGAFVSGCGDTKDVMSQCLSESSFGPKLAAAFEECGIAGEASSRFGKLVNKCPSTMEIMMKFGMRYKDEVCVFQAVGWMDDQGEMIEDVVFADVSTFPTEVQTALAIPNLQECVGNFMETLMSKPEAEECMASYSEDDLNLIHGLAIGAGHIECFVAIFEGSCDKYAGC